MMNKLFYCYWLLFLNLCVFTGFSFSDDFAEFRTSELQCFIGNNSDMGEHRAGYNGIFLLSSIHQKSPLFMPAYAGINIEHVFDGSDAANTTEILFEPRRSPMAFRKIDARTAELHQPPTPRWQTESTSRFHLVDPYYIDVDFRCTPQKDVFQGGAFGIFWASYINEPEDKSIYFLQGGSSLEKPMWQQFCTQFHNHDSTVKWISDPFNWTLSPTLKPKLFTQISQITYAEPFFYGRYHNMVYLVMFPTAQGVRFAQSPSGGGNNKAGDDSCPAWDFQFVVPRYEIGKEYSLQFRMVYKEWQGREDIIREFKEYQKMGK